MEKKKYSKPVVVAERFEPQEYCSVCWYVEKEDMYTSLYADSDRDGRYDDGEELGNLPTPTRLPDQGSYKDIQLPSPMSSQYYSAWAWDVEWLLFVPLPYRRYTTQASPVYSYNGYYFRRYKTSNNAS